MGVVLVLFRVCVGFVFVLFWLCCGCVMVWFGLCFGFVLLCFVLFRFDIVLLCSEFVVGFIVFYFCCVSVMFTLAAIGLDRKSVV